MIEGPAAAPLGAAEHHATPAQLTTEAGAELTVIVPTFEERENVAPLIARLAPLSRVREMAREKVRSQSRLG